MSRRDLRDPSGQNLLTPTHFRKSSESGFTGLEDFQDCRHPRHSQLNPANPEIQQILILMFPRRKAGTHEAKFVLDKRVPVI